MMKNIEYRGYEANVKYNEKKNCYTAKVPGVTGLYVFAKGNTEEELEKNFKKAVDENIHYSEVIVKETGYTIAA